MKTLITLLICCISLVSKSQTNRLIFDFDIGDVIQSHGYTNGQTGTSQAYVTRTVLNKIVSVNSDTITYTIKVDQYIPLPCQTCTPSITSNTITQIVTDLNNLVTYNNQTSCNANPTVTPMTKDTTYYAYCNKLCYERHPNPDPNFWSNANCIEGISETSIFIEGLGGPYYHYSNNMSMATYNQMDYTLVYYNKMSGICGTLVTSLKENSNTSTSIKLFPNPTKDILNIENASSDFNLSITDLYGKVIYNRAHTIIDSKVDLQKFSAGIYFVKISGNNFNKTEKIVKE